MAVDRCCSGVIEQPDVTDKAVNNIKHIPSLLRIMFNSRFSHLVVGL
jgi:hypothetical protein